MYKYILPLGIVLILFCECQNKEFKQCEFKSEDIHLKIYNDILNYLIEQRFYGGYLGAKGDSLFEKYRNLENPDTTKFNQEIINLQNEIFNDTSKFRTLCYRPCLKSGPWTYYLSKDNHVDYDTTRAWLDLKDVLTDFSESWKAIADTLAMAEDNYAIDDFNLCTAKLIEGEHFYDGDIGVVSFSKIVLNSSKTKGLLYYEFSCGGLCGMGEIIVVEVFEGKWRIKKVNQLWIS